MDLTNSEVDSFAEELGERETADVKSFADEENDIKCGCDEDDDAALTIVPRGLRG